MVRVSRTQRWVAPERSLYAGGQGVRQRGAEWQAGLGRGREGAEIGQWRRGRTGEQGRGEGRCHIQSERSPLECWDTVRKTGKIRKG